MTTKEILLNKEYCLTKGCRNKWVLRLVLKVWSVQQWGRCGGSGFQTAGVDTEKQRPARTRRVRGTARRQWRWHAERSPLPAWRVQTDHGAHVGRCIIGVQGLIEEAHEFVTRSLHGGSAASACSASKAGVTWSRLRRLITGWAAEFWASCSPRSAAADWPTNRELQ